MIFSPIQVILVVFALFAITRVVMKWRSRSIPRVWGVLWALVWIGLIVVAVLPQTADLLAGSVGIGRGADLVVYVAVIVLFYGVFRLVVKVQKMEREMTKLVRSIAVKDLDKE